MTFIPNVISAEYRGGYRIPNGADIAPETLYEDIGVREGRANKRMPRTGGAARKSTAARR